LDGGIDSLNYFVVSGINNQNVIDFGTFALTKNLDGSYYGEISVTAVPEPETYALMLAGLGLVGFAARRKSMR
jgi:spore coat protein U-like protein